MKKKDLQRLLDNIHDDQEIVFAGDNGYNRINGCSEIIVKESNNDDMVYEASAPGQQGHKYVYCIY
jgi:hypothetical protein